MKNLVFLFTILTIISVSKAQNMNISQPTITFKEKSNGYSNVAIIDHGSYKMLYISGQVSAQSSLEGQIREVFIKIENILKAEGGSYSNLIKMNHYLVGYTPEHLAIFRKIRQEFFGDTIAPASTLVGVEALGQPEWMVEIEATALIPK